jgi:hypothetical protein
MKTGKTRGFRPRAENVERLEYCEKIGLSVSEVINDVLAKHLKDYLAEKTVAMKAALKAPIP